MPGASTIRHTSPNSDTPTRVRGSEVLTSYRQSVQPGNLVFLVIVAIWAVYLVQHWIRRREHVATARSVDRFSEAMRVLERRVPLPRNELAAPHPPSYAVRSPTARPTVVVKRAPQSSRSTPSPLSGRPPLSGRSPLAARSVRPGRPARRSSRERLVRRVRGVAFLVTLAAIPVTLVLAIANVLLWVSVGIAVAAFVVVVAGLRAAVKRDLSVGRAASAAARRRYARPAARAAAPAACAAAPAASHPRPTASPVWGENASPRTLSHPDPEGVISASGETASEALSEAASEALVARARHSDEVYDVTAYVARPGTPSTTCSPARVNKRLDSTP